MATRMTTYNNEALAAVTLGYFISLHEEVVYTKLLLILPFIFHEQTARKLRGTSHKKSLDEFIIGNIDCMSDFNRRFQEFLPVCINAIILLSEMKVVTMKFDRVSFNRGQTNFNPSVTSSLVGKRAMALFTSLDNLTDILKSEDSIGTYLKLKIIL